MHARMTSDSNRMSRQSLTPLSQNQLVGKTRHILILVMGWFTHIVLLLGVKLVSF